MGVKTIKTTSSSGVHEKALSGHFKTIYLKLLLYNTEMCVMQNL